MSKQTVVDVNLKFVIEETGAFPPYEGKCEITCKGADGKEWKGSARYDDGRNVEDAIKTICRMDSFRATLPQLAVVASDSSPEEKKPEEKKPAPPTPVVSDTYSDIKSELMKKKMGELRKIISDQILNITTGGKKKHIVIDEIISSLKARDGITEDTSDEES